MFKAQPLILAISVLLFCQTNSYADLSTSTPNGGAGSSNTKLKSSGISGVGTNAAKLAAATPAGQLETLAANDLNKGMTTFPSIMTNFNNASANANAASKERAAAVAAVNAAQTDVSDHKPGATAELVKSQSEEIQADNDFEAAQTERNQAIHNCAAVVTDCQNAQKLAIAAITDYQNAKTQASASNATQTQINLSELEAMEAQKAVGTNNTATALLAQAQLITNATAN